MPRLREQIGGFPNADFRPEGVLEGTMYNDLLLFNLEGFWLNFGDCSFLDRVNNRSGMHGAKIIRFTPLTQGNLQLFLVKKRSKSKN
jgi:hypothetical protein